MTSTVLPAHPSEDVRPLGHGVQTVVQQGQGHLPHGSTQKPALLWVLACVERLGPVANERRDVEHQQVASKAWWERQHRRVANARCHQGLARGGPRGVDQGAEQCVDLGNPLLHEQTRHEVAVAQRDFFFVRDRRKRIA